MAALVFALGVALIAYPYVSDFLHKRNQRQVVNAYVASVDSSDEKELSEEMARSRDYNERLLSSKTVVTDPFDPEAQRVTSEEYESLLNLSGDGVMGTLVIPKIDLQMPIYHYTNEEELQEGVGHMESTSLPVGGPSTHAVLAGHNGLPSVKIFDRLDELELGDYFVIEVLGEEHAYRVTDKETVLPEETGSLVVQQGCDLVTLVTCTPYGVNTHRLLVHAERCDLPASWGEKDRELTDVTSSEASVPLLEFTLMGLAVAVGIGVSYVLARQRVRARRVAEMPRGRHFATSGAVGARSGASRTRAGDATHHSAGIGERSGDAGPADPVRPGGAVGVNPAVAPRSSRGAGRNRRG